MLPSKALRILDAGVFWPVAADPLSRLTGVFPFPSSDHRLVWVDVRVPGAAATTTMTTDDDDDAITTTGAGATAATTAERP